MMNTAMSFTNMFSSVAADTATNSSCANYAIMGTAPAVPFFVFIGIISLIYIANAIIITGIILNIIIIITLYKYCCKTKQSTLY